MSSEITRILIETVIKKTLRDLKDSPERSVRNLVDMALQFSNGRFQQRFFEATQTMLKNENSAYYRLIRDAAFSISEERVLTFGMNLGYNSCTSGAKLIRQTEEKEHFNIPWSIALEIDGSTYQDKVDKYESVIAQGESLGIYSWLIFADELPQAVLPLAAKHPNHAFAIFCTPDGITQTLLDEAEPINNVMFVVCFDDQAQDACQLLREHGHIYSVYMRYQEDDVADILSGDLFYDAEALRPMFTMLLADPSCSSSSQQIVYDHITMVRNEQMYQTIAWDMIYDSCFVDGIISDEACAAGFDKSGCLCTLFEPHKLEEYNLFEQPLSHILRKAFPKVRQA